MTEGDELCYAVNCSILFTELPLTQRPAAAREAGFSAIELWWPFAEAVPAEREIAELVEAVNRAGVRVIACNSFAGDMPAGERGIVSHPERTAEFRDNIEALADLAERLDCRMFNVLYGNRLPGVGDATHRKVAVDNLVFACAALDRIAGTVLIEPVSGVDGYPLRTAADAVEVVEAVRGAGRSNIAFLLDSFHLANNGDDAHRAMAEHAPLVGHVQIADCPGRGAPGTGEFDFPEFFRLVAAHRGSSWVSLEYQASGGTIDALSWLPRQARARVPA